MNVDGIKLLAPEMVLVATALVVILCDAFDGVMRVKNKNYLIVIALIGIIIAVLTVALLWNGDIPQSGLLGSVMLDKFALFFKSLALGICAITLIILKDWVAVKNKYHGEYIALLLLSTVGVMVISSATELISIYVAIELVTLPLIALVALGKDTRSAESGIKFLILSALSSGSLLYGFVLLYAITGTTYTTELSNQIINGFGENSLALLMAISFIIAGFGFKVSAVPFQLWVPDVYEGSPIPVVAFLSTASKAAGFAIFLRLFQTSFTQVDVDWWMLIAIISVASMTIGNIGAIAQSNIKRLLGYSTIAHAGYILVGVTVLVSPAATLGVQSVLFYIAGYAFTNLTAFMCVMTISHKINSENIDDFAGISTSSPWLAAILVLSFVSLLGLPPTVGLMGKIFLFNAAVQADLAWLALVGFLNSVVSAYYYLKVIRVVYSTSEVAPSIIKTPLVSMVTLCILSIGIILLGIVPGTLLAVADSAAHAIIGG